MSQHLASPSSLIAKATSRMRKLQVWSHSNHVGTIAINDDGRWSFSYDPAWNKFALSPHLLIGSANANDLMHQRTVEWFFDNLLPEGALREALAKREFIHKDDSWGLLTHYGQDTAGALSILPDDITPGERQEYTPLSMEHLAEMIDKSKAGVPLMTQGENPHMSLAGAQEKLALRVDTAGNYSMPEGTAPSTHILKPENISKAYPFCPANEWFCMTLAGMARLKVPAVDIVSIGSHRVYIVQRYDRREESNFGIRRLHQIDLCQARNVSPHAKYEDHAGLSVKDLFLVASSCSVPAVANSVSMEWMAFNYIIGNGDAHAKNISFMMHGQKPEVAPLYDLLCVDAYHNNLQLSMGIGGEMKAGWITGCHWDALALENRMDPRAMRTILARTATNVKRHMDAIMLSGKLLTSEKEWLNDCVRPVINQRLSFVSDALQQQVCNSETIQTKQGIVSDEVLSAIQNLENSDEDDTPSLRPR